MKNTQILVSLILILAVCFSATAAQTENTTNTPNQKSNYRLAFGFDFPVLVGNSEFSDFMSEHFDMKTPNALYGVKILTGFHFTESKRWFWELEATFRGSNREKNNINRDWTQIQTSLKFAYAIIDNEIFRMSPFVGFTYGSHQLKYSDMRSIGNVNSITQVFETDFKSFDLAQWYVGSEFGLIFDFDLDPPSNRRRRTPSFSAFIKWEQPFHNSKWQLGKFEMRDVPKFQGSALVMGFTLGI
ncbi:MAG: hypothetical protein LBH22_01805 [Bacteroidales bacterium]|jgi:hypothetical protein|nr:hypothetical protein [Bacteroidales bacterium]